MSVACAVPEREGKSGGGGLLSSDDAGFKSAPGRRNAGNQLNQAPEYGGGSGRATRKQKPLLPCVPSPLRPTSQRLCRCHPQARVLRPPFHLQV